MFTGSQGIVSKLPRSVKAAALSVSLVLSALVTAVALQSPDHYWLAWISFLPLFVAIRWLRPLAAALSGALWGVCLCLFYAAAPTSAVYATGLAIDPTTPTIGLSACDAQAGVHAHAGPSVWLLALLMLIPAVYVGLAARPARAVGFNLLTLALGWTLVEAVLHLHNVSGTGEGLLIDSQAEGLHMHWLARLLAYVCTAFLVASVNGSLVSILSGARLSFPACRSLAGWPSAFGWAQVHLVFVFRCWTRRQIYPRAPPIQVRPTIRPRDGRSQATEPSLRARKGGASAAHPGRAERPSGWQGRP